jgi:hypothetical protein
VEAPQTARPLSPRAEKRRSRQAELNLARRRASLAKGILGIVGAAAFGAVIVVARHSYPGHSKQPAHPLTAPPRFVSVVRQNLLQAGIVAPAQAPAGAATSVS